MEDVLNIYARPHVCVDQGAKQLIGDVRKPLPARPGTRARHDGEYTRGGMANLFMCFQPLAGIGPVQVTRRKRSIDFAHFLKTISDQWHSQAHMIVLACDNLSTHTPAALYEAFTPAEAHLPAPRFEWHYTPNLAHG